MYSGRNDFFDTHTERDRKKKGIGEVHPPSIRKVQSYVSKIRIALVDDKHGQTFPTLIN